MTRRPSDEEAKAAADRTQARSRGHTATDEVIATALIEGEINAEVAKLAALPVSVYETCRRAEAERLNMRPSVLDAEVKKERGKAVKAQRHAAPVFDPDKLAE